MKMDASASKGGSPSAVRVAKRYGVTEKTIRDIWIRRTWRKETESIEGSSAIDRNKIRPAESQKKIDPSQGISLGNLPDEFKYSKCDNANQLNGYGHDHPANFKGQNNPTAKTLAHSCLKGIQDDNGGISLFYHGTDAAKQDMFFGGKPPPLQQSLSSSEMWQQASNLRRIPGPFMSHQHAMLSAPVHGSSRLMFETNPDCGAMNGYPHGFSQGQVHLNHGDMRMYARRQESQEQFAHPMECADGNGRLFANGHGPHFPMHGFGPDGCIDVDRAGIASMRSLQALNAPRMDLGQLQGFPHPYLGSSASNSSIHLPPDAKPQPAHFSHALSSFEAWDRASQPHYPGQFPRAEPSPMSSTFGSSSGLHLGHSGPFANPLHQGHEGSARSEDLARGEAASRSCSSAQMKMLQGRDDSGQGRAERGPSLLQPGGLDPRASSDDASLWQARAGAWPPGGPGAALGEGLWAARCPSGNGIGSSGSAVLHAIPGSASGSFSDPNDADWRLIHAATMVSGGPLSMFGSQNFWPDPSAMAAGSRGGSSVWRTPSSGLLPGGPESAGAGVAGTACSAPAGGGDKP